MEDSRQDNSIVTTVPETSVSIDSQLGDVDSQRGPVESQPDSVESQPVQPQQTTADTHAEQPTSCNLVSDHTVPDEPIIEIPLTAESSGQVFKLRVSMTDFCNLPIKKIINVDGTRHHLIEISNPLPVDNQLNLCQNTSSSPQISSTTVSNTHGEGGVSLWAGSCDLPTQVGVNQQGSIQLDFPFDTLPTKQKKVISNTTLVAAATTTRKEGAETSTETSSDDSHVFGMRAAEQLVQSFATIAHAQGRFSEELFSDSSEQKLFLTDNSTLDTTHSGEGNKVTEEQDSTAGTSTLEVDVTQNEDQPDKDAVAEDQLEEGNIVAADQNNTEGTNTLEAEVTQNEDQPDEDAVTED